MAGAASTPAHAAVATAHPSKSAVPAACGTITAETARFGSTPAGVQLMYNQCTRNVWAFANTNLFGSNTACASSGFRCENAVEAINSSGHPFSSVCSTPTGSHYCTTSQIGDANTTSYAVGVYEDYQGNVWYAQTGNF
jgi:hypothetical protein